MMIILLLVPFIITLGQNIILIAILYSISIIFFIMCIVSDILSFLTKLYQNNIFSTNTILCMRNTIQIKLAYQFIPRMSSKTFDMFIAIIPKYACCYRYCTTKAAVIIILDHVDPPSYIGN